MKARFTFRDSLKLIKSIGTSGTITPSSRILIRSLLEPINFEQAGCIVELGPGNGCVTKVLLSKMRPDSLLLCFEVNQDFIAELEKLNDPRLRIINRCASSIHEVLLEMGIDKVDHVVSSLPLAIIEDDVRESILSNVDSNLRDGGRFMQYQYSLKNYADMKSVFRHVKLNFTFRNLPPAIVYECMH